MKNILPGLLAVVCITLLASCHKDKNEPEIVTCYFPPFNGTIDHQYITLAPNQSYSLNLGSFGDEEGASIKQQAIHYAVSNIETQTGAATFNYQPAKDFTGADGVVILSTRGANGASANSRLTYTYIHFTITSNSAN